jgi:hypothetical protein
MQFQNDNFLKQEQERMEYENELLIKCKNVLKEDKLKKVESKKKVFEEKSNRDK